MAAGIPGLPPELQAEAAAEVAAALKEKAGDGDALPAGIPESGNLPAAQVVKMSAEEKARLKAAREGVTPEGPEPPVEQSDAPEAELPAPQDEDAQDAYAEYLKVCDEEIEFLRKQRKAAGPHAHEVALAVVDIAQRRAVAQLEGLSHIGQRIQRIEALVEAIAAGG